MTQEMASAIAGIIIFFMWLGLIGRGIYVMGVRRGRQEKTREEIKSMTDVIDRAYKSFRG